MKALFILMMGMLSLSAVSAQTTNSQPTNSPTDKFQKALQIEAARLSGETLPAIQFGEFNEIKAGRLSYSGIVVAIFKSKRPLQLLNPAAPPEFGFGADNLLRDLTSNRVSGLRLFSISFW